MPISAVGTVHMLFDYGMAGLVVYSVSICQHLIVLRVDCLVCCQVLYLLSDSNR